MILFAIIFRTVSYYKIERALIDRYNTFRNDVDSIMYYQIDEVLDFVEARISNFNEADLKFICTEASKQEAVNKLIKLRTELEYVSDIYVALEDGLVYGSSINSDFAGTENEKWYYETVRTKKSIVSAKNSNTSNPSILVTTPLYLDDVFRGVIAAEINSDSIKKIITSLYSDAKQVVLKDKDGEVMFKLNRIITTTQRDSKRNFEIKNPKETITYSTHQFSIESCNSLQKPYGTLNTFKIVFAILYCILIVFYILSLFLAKARMNLIKGAFGIFILAMAEWIAISIGISSKYDEDINELIECTRKNMVFTESIYNEVADELYKVVINALPSGENEQNEENIRMVGKATSPLKSIYPLYVGSFNISKEGTYSFIPEVENDEMTKINFKNNRILLNDYFKSSISSFDRIDNEMIYSKLYKVKDSNGEIVGVIGINLEVPSIIDFISDNYAQGNKKLIYEVLNDGSLYSRYYNETYKFENGKKYEGNLEFKFNNKRKDYLLSNENGVVSSSNSINAKRYVFITDYDRKTKNMIYVTLENKVVIGSFFVVSIIILFFGLCILALVSKILTSYQVLYVDEEEVENEFEKNFMNQKANNDESEDIKLNQRLQIFDKELITKKIKNDGIFLKNIFERIFERNIKN